MRESEKSNTARLLAKSLRLDIVGIMMVLTRVVEGTLLAAARRKCGISGGSKQRVLVNANSQRRSRRQ
jgi:hypothetical protein